MLTTSRYPTDSRTFPEQLQAIRRSANDIEHQYIESCQVTWGKIPAVLAQIVRTPAELCTAQPGAIEDNLGVMTIMAGDCEVRRTTNFTHRDCLDPRGPLSAALKLSQIYVKKYSRDHSPNGE